MLHSTRGLRHVGGRKSQTPVSLHAASIMHTNVVTDIRIARDAGYDGLELWIPKLMRYLDVGYTVEELVQSLGSLPVTMLDCLVSIERTDSRFRHILLRECERLAPVAARLGCPALQVVALDDFAADDWATQRRVLVWSLTELAEIVSGYGVRLAIEPVSFSRFHSIEHALELVHAVGQHRVGIVLDTWHLWTSGAHCDEVAALDPSLIICAQVGDTNPRAGLAWSDDDRTALPGDGVLPLREVVDAILHTGYDGVWSVELLSKRHWEWAPDVLAVELLRRVRDILTPS